MTRQAHNVDKSTMAIRGIAGRTVVSARHKPSQTGQLIWV